MDWLVLPEVALIRVLNCLSVRDQLNVRLVCRHWKLIIDSSVQRNELILFLEMYPRPAYWYHDGSEVDLGNAFLITDLAVMKNEFFLRCFRKVRRLMIAHRLDDSSHQFIEQIQVSFLQLEHLQFSAFDSKSSRSGFRNQAFKHNLDLPNLRTFYSQARDMPSGFHCPKLTELFVYSNLVINESTDEKTKSCIQNLRLLMVWQLTYPRGFEFSNLKIFYFDKPSSIYLSDFSRLEEIHYFNNSSFLYFELKDYLENIFEQKRSLKLDRPRIYFDGFQLGDQKSFETLNAYLHSDEPLCALDLNEHILRLTRDSPSFWKFNLLSKELQLSNSLDDDLIDLFEDDVFVEGMLKSVTEITFEQRLSKKSLNFFDLYLVDRFRYVFAVGINVELSQALLDQLPDAMQNLVNFDYEPTFFSNYILNFQFLGRFNSLHSFYVHHHLISMDELRFTFENCKFINRIYFERSNKAGVTAMEVRMRRLFGCNVFLTNWASTDAVLFATAVFTVEELLDYLEASRWLEKNDFLGEREEGKLAPLFLRPPNEND